MIANMVAVMAPMLNMIQTVPQLLHTWREKTLDGLSIHSIGLMMLVEILWLMHGYYINDYSLMISSLVIFMVNLCIIGMYIMYHGKSKN